MQHSIDLFLRIYFWVFIGVTVGLPIYRYYFKTKGTKMPVRHEPGFLETVIATVIFIMSIFS